MPPMNTPPNQPQGGSDPLEMTRQMSEAVAKQAEGIRKAREEQERLNKAMADPVAKRELEYREAVTGRLARLQKEQTALDHRRRFVASGGYAAELRGLTALTRERERVAQLERRAEFQARYGRAGAAAYYADRFANSKAARLAGGAAVGAAGTVTGMAARGFSGTVEMNQLQLQLKLVSRGLAGAFLPAIQWATRALRLLNRYLEGLSGRQQNRLMLGAGAVLGTAAAGSVARNVFGVSLAGAVGAGGRMLLGGGGAAGAGALPATAAGGVSGASAAAGGVGGLGLAAPFAVGASALNALLQQRKAYNRPFTFEGTAESLVPGYGLARDVERRARGRPAVPGSALEQPKERTLFDKVIEGAVPGYGLFQEGRRRMFGPPGQEDKQGNGHRRPMIADAGFEAPGGAYDRVATSLALTDANVPQDKGPTDILSDIYELIKDAIGARGLSKPEMPGK